MYEEWIAKSKKYFFFIFVTPLKKTFIRVYLGILLLMNGLNWMLTRFVYSRVEGQNIALHYSVDFGIDFYGPSSKIFIIPVLATFFLILNTTVTFLTRLYLPDNFRFISHVLLSATIIISLILFGAVVSVYLVNFR